MLETHEQALTRLFNAMNEAEAESYAASEKARNRRQNWEKSCELAFLAKHPEIQILLSNINDLKLKLDMDRRKLELLAERENMVHMFRKYL